MQYNHIGQNTMSDSKVHSSLHNLNEDEDGATKVRMTYHTAVIHYKAALKKLSKTFDDQTTSLREVQSRNKRAGLFICLASVFLYLIFLLCELWILHLSMDRFILEACLILTCNTIFILLVLV
eukprot:GHVH01011083.1.p1 GENE.GHVH01011083.1~~GHVH01011083.1.p1  ORF type:complete len:123 (-),score=7.96 GHVH01011083.1:25-393(-)